MFQSQLKMSLITLTKKYYNIICKEKDQNIELKVILMYITSRKDYVLVLLFVG